jgi:glycosyltransferase involved in cell wall biosynthesis
VNAAVRSSVPPAELDPEVKLSLPATDVVDPELSIVIPSLNEELTMADFVDWCLEGLKKADVRGEILIIDSGSDRAGEIALEHGARVLKTPKRGLGRAYQDALPYIRGKFILMGDCDCTYDFRELAPFVKEFRAGAEFVMGSRFRGYIEPGAMPPLHRYFGTPGTTWILNTIFSSHFSDIHCGMRGISKAAFLRMDLQSQSWQYASEMVLKSVHMRLRTAEVPIRFLKDREGRLSHHKRSGWFSPWQAAWINLQAMFVYGADFFLFKPGLFLLALGSCLTFPLAFGPITLGPITFSTYWMLLGVSLALLGMQCVYMGVLAKVFFDYSGETKAKWFRRFSYTRAVSASAFIFTLGLAFAASLAATYFENHFSFPGTTNNLGIVGLLLMIEGFMTFTFTLILHSTAVAVRRR